LLAPERTGLLAIGTGRDPAMVWMSPVVAAQIQASMPDDLSGRAVTAAVDALLEAGRTV
jgi:hypothetical protein